MATIEVTPEVNAFLSDMVTTYMAHLVLDGQVRQANGEFTLRWQSMQDFIQLMFDATPEGEQPPAEWVEQWRRDMEDMDPPETDYVV